MVVAVGAAGVDARGFDDDRGGRVREVLGDVGRTGHVVERSAHTRDHRVTGGEAQSRMGGIDVPMACQPRRLCHGVAPSVPPRSRGRLSSSGGSLEKRAIIEMAIAYVV